MAKIKPARLLIDNNLKTGSKAVQKVKTMIRRSVYPEKLSVGSMALAILAINSYEQSNNDSQEQIDLMLFFVECGSQFTLDYGDMDEDFYEVLEEVFEQALFLIKKDSSIIFELYKDRMVNLVEQNSHIGWGYADIMQELLQTYFPSLFVTEGMK